MIFQFLVPIFAAIGSAVTAVGAWWAGLGALAQTAFKLVALVGLNFLARPKKQKPPGGIETTLQLGADVPRMVGLGRCASRGHLTFWNTYGNDNKSGQFVFDLSDSHCNGLVGAIVDGDEKTLVPQTAVHGEDERYTLSEFGSNITIQFYSGKVGQIADQGLIDNSNPAGRWTTNDKKTGICFVIVTIEWDDEKFDDIPEFFWVFEGTLLYDWRKDSTNGGSGSHRWGTPSTYEYSENPAVILYNVFRGIVTAGTHVLGLTVLAQDLHNTSFTAAANACDEAVTLDAGGTEPRYRGSFIAKDDELEELREAIVNAMGGFTVEIGGRIGVMAGVAQSSFDTITDDDLIIGETVRYSGKRSRAELVNAVFGTFTDPDNLWQSNSFPPLISTLYETEDGERLARDMDLPGVRSKTQAERLAKIRLLELRYQASAEIVLGYDKIDYQAGKWITWQSDHYGWTKVFRIATRRTEALGGRVRVQLDEIASVVYDWSTSEEQPLPASGTLGDTGLLATGVTNLVSIQAENDGTILKITYDPITDPTVDAIHFQIREINTTNWVPYSDPDPSDGSTLWPNAQPGKKYEVRATLGTTPKRSIAYTAWTASAIMEQFDIYNWVKNNHFQSGAVDPSAAQDVPNFFIEQSPDRVDILTRFDAEVTALNGTVPVEFSHVMKLQTTSSPSTTPIVYTEYDPALSSALGLGVPVEVGDEVTTHCIGQAVTSAKDLTWRLLVKPKAGGTPVAQVNKQTGGTTATVPFDAVDWNDTIPTFNTVRWEIATEGEAFWEVSGSDNGTIYITGLKMYRRDATKIIGEQAIIEQQQTNIATGVNDIAGTGIGNFHDAISASITATIPKDETVLGVAEAKFFQTYTASDSFDARVEVDGNHDWSAGDTDVELPPIYTASIELEGTGESKTYTATLKWAGGTDVDLKQRQITFKLLKK